MQQQQQPEFRHIPIGQLVFSQTTAQKERRAHFSKEALKELTANVGAVGIAQPILVRPLFQDDHAELNQFEVCAGERRVLAAKGAGLDQVPAMVRRLTDEQLLTMQLVENLQREGLSELAEAEGYEKLMSLGHSADEIATKVGKSRSYVYGRMKLTDLCKDARAAFYEGKLSASTALELAKIPDEGQQKKALKEITAPRHGNPLSVREARDLIQNNYMLRLANAGFPTEDATLVAKAGTCAACPKRSGNLLELFSDAKSPDICTDVVCFRSKVAAFGVRAIAEAKKTGQTVLTGAAAEKAAPHGALSYLPDHVRLIDKSWDHGNKTFAEIFGKDYVPILLQDTESGKLIEIAPRKDIPKVKRPASTRTSAGSRSSSAKDDGEQAKREIESMLRWALVKRIYDKAPATPTRDFLLKVCSNEVFSGDEEEIERVAKECGLSVSLSTSSDHEKAFAKLTTPQLGRLAYLLLMVSTTSMEGHGKATELEEAAAALKIDCKKVRAEIQAAAKASAKPADPKPAKAKSAAKKSKATTPARKK